MLQFQVQNALQPQQESLHGSMQALTLWQHKIMQAVTAQAQARLSVLATAYLVSLALCSTSCQLGRPCVCRAFCLPTCVIECGESQDPFGETAGHVAVGE